MTGQGLADTKVSYDKPLLTAFLEDRGDGS